MSTVIAERKTPYQSLLELPENIVGEIMNGQLYTQPRPAGPHALACASLEIEIGSAYHKGRGGPGGWWIIVQPEIHFVRDTEVLVPDLAGWRRERFPKVPRDHRFEVVPDWVCEIQSPSTARDDRVTKMPIYAHYGVPYLWLVDPLARTLEVFTLERGRWTIVGLYGDQAEANIPPFQEIALQLAELWAEV